MICLVILTYCLDKINICIENGFQYKDIAILTVSNNHGKDIIDYLENNNIRTVYYNAWENDDSDSAILPLLYRIISLIKDVENENFIDYAKKFLKTLTVETTKFGLKNLLGINSEIEKIIEKGLDDLSSTELSNIFKEYDQYYGDRKALEENLREMVPEDGKLWIFIDDLDRCKPEFSIATLECIKHFFNIRDIIYIFSIDIEQLGVVVSKVYGKEIESNSYLKRFFDIIYQIPDADYIIYIKNKIENMNITAEIKALIQCQTLAKLFRHFHCSLRDINLSLTHLEIFMIRNKENILQQKISYEALKIYYYFIVIKDKYNINYLDIIHGNYTLEENENSYRLPISKFYIYNEQIRKLLGQISDGRAMLYTKDIIKQFGLFEDDNIDTFKQHMETYLS